MISSQPSGGEEPPRRSESGPSRPRDGPARSHTLPYDRADRTERYEKPRPARRDSRAGPDVRERDWRRPSRPSNQYAQSNSALHASNRRDDRSARDRLIRERRRFERPRDRTERQERMERAERQERTDKLDRRSSWQHTSAPYVRENGHHDANGHGHAGSARVHEEDESRVSRNERSEPRFTRRPGNSFWDLMKGEPQRSGKSRSISNKPEGREESRTLDESRVHDEKRARHAERPKTENLHGHAEFDRDDSQSVSPRSPYPHEVRQMSAEPRTPPAGITRQSESAPESRGDLKGGKTEQRTESERSAKPHEDALKAGRNKGTAVSSKRDELEHTTMSSVEQASIAEAEVRESKVERVSASHEHRPIPTTAAGITADGVGAEQIPNGVSSRRVDGRSKDEPAEPSTVTAKVSPVRIAATDNCMIPAQGRGSARGAEQASLVTENREVSVEDRDHGEEDCKAAENVINVRDSGAAASERATTFEEDSRDAGHANDKTVSAAAAKASNDVVAMTDADAVNGAVANTEGATNVVAGVVAAKVVNGEAVSTETTRIEETDAEKVPANIADISAETDHDVEMSDAAVTPGCTSKSEPQTEVMRSHIEDFLNYAGRPSILSEESIVGTLPKPVSERHGLSVVQTPQEAHLQHYLASQYDILSSEVPPNSVVSKKWILSAPDPRVSLAAMTQYAELQDDIRARQIEFAERKSQWVLFCKQLDDEAASRPKAALPQNSSKESASSNHARRRSKDFEPEVHRRSRERSRAHGDVARSEAEFLEILANLEAETARDPLVRARQTSARIPLQRQGPVAFRFRSTDALVVDHSELTKRLKTDALDDFTAEEHERFVDAYLKYPKEFGRIAEAVGRGFNECVMHYYRTKKLADYKHLLQKRRKSKRGRKPKKKEVEGELPTTPSLEGGFQFESPGTPRTPFTPSDSAAASASPTSLAAPHTTITGPNAIAGDQTDHGAAQAVPPHAQTAERTGRAELGESTAIRPSDAHFASSEHAQQSAESQQALTQAALDSRIPPPVFPLTEQTAVKVNSSGDASFDGNWPPSSVAQLEHLFGLYGSRLDEIAQQMGLPSEVVRDYYERNHHKYLNVIQRTDSLNARSKTVGPNAGFFPPRNKTVPVAKAPRTKQDQLPRPVAFVQPIQPMRQPEYPLHNVQGPGCFGEVPPVVQPASLQHEQPIQQERFQPALASGSRPQAPAEPQTSAKSQSPRHEAADAAQHRALAEMLRPTQRDLSMVWALNLSTLPVPPCLPDPERIAGELYNQDYAFQRYRESNERRPYAPA